MNSTKHSKKKDLIPILKLVQNKKKTKKKQKTKKQTKNRKGRKTSQFILRSITLIPKPNKDSTRSKNYRGSWVAQSVECPTSAQVMISQFVSSNPASSSLLPV